MSTVAALDELLALITAAGHDGRHLHTPQQTRPLVDALAQAVVHLLIIEKQRTDHAR